MTTHSRKVSVVFATMAVAVIASTVITYWFGKRVLEASASAAPHRHLIAQLTQLLSTLKDAETGQRGFVITGDEKYVKSYDDARVRLREELSALREASMISPGQLRAIEELTQLRLSALEQTIALRRSGGFEAAAAVVRTGLGQQTMDQVRQQIAGLQDQQESALQAKTKVNDELTRGRTVVFTLTGLLTLLFTLSAYRRIIAAIKTSEAALAEAQRQKDFLAVTLSSIGDCVIVTDDAGRIAFMNGVAEKVTGWTFDEARLRPTAEVFKVINESSRDPVENPVEQVMKRGAIVGLANHTVLIRKDGSEVPIDDSGAPIRDADGTIYGVVLVFRDFSEHNEVERTLKESREAAESANKAKDDFLAALSHELRTPLTPALAAASYLADHAARLPSEFTEELDTIRRNVRLQARLVDDLLDLSRVTHGKIELHLGRVDAHAIVREALDTAQTSITEKGLRLFTALKAKKHHIWVDPVRIQQVFCNLINNAVKFTGPGGRIDIRTSNDERNRFQFEISDSGIGIEAEQQRLLFKAFEQGERSITRQFGGLGLGLAISKHLIDLHDGAITVQSGGRGCGATFKVTLDAVPNQVGQSRVRARVPHKPEKSLRILLVEDHGDTRRTLSRLLSHFGHEISVADCTRSALEIVEAKEFDVVLSDIGLPDGSGYDVISQAKRKHPVRGVALTGFGTNEDIRRGKEAGFDFHLTKPVDLHELRSVLSQVES